MKTLLLLTVVMTTACVTGDGPELSTDEQADLNTAVSNVCYYSGGTQWCQDWYSKGWCTGDQTHTARGWDYTGCTWRGWNSHGEFCGTDYPGYASGYEWADYHTHCP